MPAQVQGAAGPALAKAARSLTAAPDHALAPFAQAWEAGDLERAFEALWAAGKAWAGAPTFWYALADAAEKLSRPGDAAAILASHGR